MKARAVDDAMHGAWERIVPGTPAWKTSYPDHIQRYDFALTYVPHGSTVLDAGCGAGYGAAEVADARAARVVAIDIADDALALARQHFDRAAITWCRDDCHTLDEARAFAPYDVVINFENIEHLNEPARFVSRAADLLGPDGILLTSTPNRLLLNRLRGAADDDPSANPYHLSEFSETEFRALLEHRFGRVDIWYQCPAGATAHMLRLRSAAARLRLLAPLRAAGRLIRRLARPPHRGVHQPVGRVPAWKILDHDPGTAWTLIAVCRDPVRSAD